MVLGFSFLSETQEVKAEESVCITGGSGNSIPLLTNITHKLENGIFATAVLKNGEEHHLSKENFSVFIKTQKIIISDKFPEKLRKLIGSLLERTIVSSSKYPGAKWSIK